AWIVEDVHREAREDGSRRERKRSYRHQEERIRVGKQKCREKGRKCKDHADHRLVATRTMVSVNGLASGRTRSTASGEEASFSMEATTPIGSPSTMTIAPSATGASVATVAAKAPLPLPSRVTATSPITACVVRDAAE